MMSLFYADQFVLPLPQGHRFPMEKYRLLREMVQEFPQIELLEAPQATPEQIALAHDSSYIQDVYSGTLTPAHMREIGFPWSPEMVVRSARSAGATIAACQAAWRSGVAANLAGGTHHAYGDKGSGFCVFNDAAIAARVMQQDLLPVLGRKALIAIIDLDVHQGNGTASILKNDASIFTFSMHGEKNFPFRKEKSDLDIGLLDGCEDVTYLNSLEMGLSTIESLFKADALIYLAGADPFEGDRLGRLNLSMQGLANRDQMVLDWALKQNLPTAIVMAGGYAKAIEQTVQIHAKTIEIATGYVWQ